MNDFIFACAVAVPAPCVPAADAPADELAGEPADEVDDELHADSAATAIADTATAIRPRLRACLTQPQPSV
jgi:hypothetical protein